MFKNTLIVLILSLYSILCSAEDEIPQGLPAKLTIGDIWEFPLKFPVNCDRWEVIKVSDTENSIMRCKDYLLHFNRDATNWAKFTNIDEKVIAEYKPFIPYLDFPLFVGKKWKGNYSGFTSSNGNRWVSTVKAEVVAYEEVSVKDRSFMCYRIEVDDYWKAGGFTGSTHVTSWFSTKARHVIKNKNSNYPEWDYEVVNFQHQ